jgi:hypothetical protein
MGGGMTLMLWIGLSGHENITEVALLLLMALVSILFYRIRCPRCGARVGVTKLRWQSVPWTRKCWKCGSALD